MLRGGTFYSAIIWKGEGAYLKEMPKMFKAYLNWNFCGFDPGSEVGSK